MAAFMILTVSSLAGILTAAAAQPKPQAARSGSSRTLLLTPRSCGRLKRRAAASSAIRAGGSSKSRSRARGRPTPTSSGIAGLKSLKRLDLSLTYVSDRGAERLKALDQLEELNLFAAEFITDAAMAFLRGNRQLKTLNLRGTDVTDTSLAVCRRSCRS